MSNVVHLPRPQKDRSQAPPIALYFRVGRDQHKDMLDLLAQGEKGFFGLVIEARYAHRHRELRTEALHKGLDVVLDPNTHAMATIGGHTTGTAELPWGLSRPNRADDFSGVDGQTRAKQIVEFARANRFTQLLGPTHLLSSANDIWLRRDIEMMRWVHDELRRADLRIPLIYPLALPFQILRDPVQRQAIISAISDAPSDAIWLRVENFGQDATGEKVAAYIAACEDFRVLDRPLVADHVSGLPGLALLAFGSVGGLAHGVTFFESFKPSAWRRPKPDTEQGGGTSTRIYFAGLDMLMKAKDARAFLDSSTRVKSHFGCRNTHCCPRGPKDQLENPTRHYVHTRSEQVLQMASTPADLRIGRYLDDHVRLVSDGIAAVSGFGPINAKLKKAVEKKQKTISRFRQAMAHLAKSHGLREPMESPLSRSAREQKK